MHFRELHALARSGVKVAGRGTPMQRGLIGAGRLSLRTSIICGALVFLFRAGYGQAPEQSASQIAFEVASVKPFDRSAPRSGPVVVGAISGGPGTADPNRIQAGAVTVQILLRTAYGVQTDQISGPSWLPDNLYQIVATVPTGATREQVNVMLQNLLADRFKMVIHREKRSFQTWDLVIAKNGPKLKEAADSSAQPRVEVPLHRYSA